MAHHPAIQLQVGAKVFLRNAEGKYLLLKRSLPFRGDDICSWDIPGGRVIPGETQEQALTRELKEETGLTLQTTSAILGVQDIFASDERHVVRITYLGTCNDSHPINLNPQEHTEYAWMTLEEIHGKKHDVFLDPILERLASS